MVEMWERVLSGRTSKTSSIWNYFTLRYVCMYVQELPLRENFAMHTTRKLLRLDKYLKKGGQ